jgi:predicted transcriptional regulator
MVLISSKVQFAKDVIAYVSAVKINDKDSGPLLSKLKEIIEHLEHIQRLSLIEDTNMQSESIPFEWIQQIDRCFESETITVR